MGIQEEAEEGTSSSPKRVSFPSQDLRLQLAVARSTRTQARQNFLFGEDLDPLEDPWRGRMKHRRRQAASQGVGSEDGEPITPEWVIENVRRKQDSFRKRLKGSPPTPTRTMGIGTALPLYKSPATMRKETNPRISHREERDRKREGIFLEQLNSPQNVPPEVPPRRQEQQEKRTSAHVARLEGVMEELAKMATDLQTPINVTDSSPEEEQSTKPAERISNGSAGHSSGDSDRTQGEKAANMEDNSKPIVLSQNGAGHSSRPERRSVWGRLRRTLRSFRDKRRKKD